MNDNNIIVLISGLNPKFVQKIQRRLDDSNIQIFTQKRKINKHLPAAEKFIEPELY